MKKILKRFGEEITLFHIIVAAWIIYMIVSGISEMDERKDREERGIKAIVELSNQMENIKCP